MIPEAAVEAAAIEFAAIADPLGDWEAAPDSYRTIYRERATRILEAAAPHMLVEAKAEALEEAAQTIENYAKDGADADASPYETAGWLRARAAKLRE